MSPSPIALLCLPCAGASATMYERWRFRAPRWIQVIPVELPGRGVRATEPFSTDFAALVEQLCLEHARILERPHALFGHSMGGLLAHGMAAHALRHHRRLPAMLFTSASPAPSTDSWKFSGKDNDATLLQDLRRYGGAPEDVFDCPEMLRVALDTLAADYVVCNSVQSREPARLPVPLRVLAGRDDDIKLQQLAAWREETHASFALHWFNGGHFYLRAQEDAVLRLLVKELGSSPTALKENTEAPPPALPV